MDRRADLKIRRRPMKTRLVPLVLITLTLLFSAVYSQSPFKGCKPEGLGKKTKSNPTGKLSLPKTQLNLLKNRDSAPTAIDSSVTLMKVLDPKNDKLFKPTQGVDIVGFVAHVKPGEAQETCNCSRDDLTDIHIDVVAKESDKDTSSKYMIVE